VFANTMLHATTHGFVIPGRASWREPGIHNLRARDGILCLSPRQQETRHALSRRDQRPRAARIRASNQAEAVESFTSRYGVDKLVWFEVYDDATTAIAREKELKKWRHDWKIRLIEEQNPGWVDLYPGIAM
jgi:putative endonuclease